MQLAALVEHHHASSARSFAFRGREVDTAGDGFFARSTARSRGPVRGGDRDRVRELGIDIRAGLHTGECELADGKIAGIAVNIGARVAVRQAPRGSRLQTVKDLVAGSGLAFEDGAAS